MELVVTVGLQASGKSTFCRMAYGSTHVIVSLDILRNHRRPRERQAQLIAEALGAGRSVVADNTHPTVADRAPLIAQAAGFGAEAVAVWFEADLAECRERNAEREGRARVPDRALYVTGARLTPPSRSEGFARILRARISTVGFFRVEEWDEAMP